MRKALGVSMFVWGALLSSVSAQASGKISVTTAIAGSTTASVLAGSTVAVTLCSTNNWVLFSTCAGLIIPPALTSPVVSTCPVITLLKQGPSSIKASCTTGFKATAFDATIVVQTANGPVACTSSGLIGTISNTASCNGVTVKIGK